MDNNPLRTNPLNKYMKTNPLSKYMGSNSNTEQTMQDKLIGNTLGILGGGAVAGLGYLGTKKLLKEIPKQGGSLLRGLAGLKTKDIKKLKDYGPENVFTPRLENEAFIGETLVPEVKSTIESDIASRKQGYTESINKIGRTSPVNLKNTKSVLGNILSELELIDSQGKHIQANLKSMSTSNPAYRQLYDAYKTIPKGGGISRIRVQAMRDNINKLFKDLPQDILAQDVKLAMYSDLENAGATGLGKAASEYAKVYKLEDMADESKLNSLFKRGASVKGKELTRRAIKQVLPESADRIIADLEKHRIAQSFTSDTGRTPATRAGYMEKGTRPIIKGYYESVYPKVQAAKQGIGKAFYRAGKGISKIGKGISGLFGAYPMVSGAIQYQQDPEAWILQNEFGIDPSFLAPIGSEERKIQLRQIT